ncbi:SMI1/KNR4 family protein [Plebeiibacterium sediminum]|uniref:SMI1/KNR4 family protein n=1 Tax=Plebeiibacterium sediminum TaxID=2992112 RepID=A0AAE3M3Q2_9BACT|nr:SMI1/KNR4 family protein [Plebeiobacterium sediminum]MCW3786294.1 SMI1/KNR4 family protein [Plebeiobacterium sediminum]
MENIEIIRKLKASTFTDEDGEKYTLEFQDGLTETEIDKLSNLFPNNTIATEIRDILKETCGWDGYGVDQVDFSSIAQFGFLELSPYSVTLGHDGLGNFWILDILNDGSLGHVYYVCHDPAVFIKYSENLNGFLSSLMEFYESPSTNFLNDIHDNVVYKIWKEGGKLIDKTDFLRENNQYSDFMSEFEGEDWVVADMRLSKETEGFAWGKFGPNNLTRRHPDDLIWVIKKKKRGLIGRLLGR